MNYRRPELRQRLASEYVLGTLHGRARRRFQRLLADDRELRDEVAFWEQQLVPMAAPLSVAAPPPEVWNRIAARVAPPGRAAPAKLSWFERWFSVRVMSGALAGLFVGVALTALLPQLTGLGPGASQTQLPESYAGFLQDAQGHPTLLVSSLRHGRLVDLKVLRPIGVGAGEVLRLWALPKDGPPLLLGLVPPQGKGRIELPATSEELLSKVGELAVSVAPRDSVVSDPAGAFILRGPCAKFW